MISPSVRFSVNMNNTPRYNALKVLNALDDRETTLDHLMDDFHRRFPDMDKRDRALVQTLVYGVLRWRKRLDWTIGQFSKTKLKKIDPKILNILRLGIFQIVFLERIPNAAAVNTSVELSKAFSASWTVGFVNGLLRNVVRKHEKMALLDQHQPIEKYLSIEHSFPEWIIRRWLSRYGEIECDSLCAKVNEIPSLSIRVNSLKTNRKQLIQDLSEKVKDIRNTPFSPEGILFSHPKIPLHRLRSFEMGEFTVQDEAAQLVTRILSPQPGEKVLDACAGLGGKTGHIAQLMKNQGGITAIDSEPSKLQLLKKDMKRLGVKTVSTRVHRIGNNSVAFLETVYDRILLDAPCSGIGVMRRNPDTKWFLVEKEIHRLAKQQLVLLESLAPMLSKNGTLLYVVCSIEPEENEAVIQNFLKRNPEFTVRSILGSQLVPESCITEEGFFRSIPHRHDMDGFFAACLCRKQS